MPVQDRSPIQDIGGSPDELASLQEQLAKLTLENSNLKSELSSVQQELTTLKAEQSNQEALLETPENPANPAAGVTDEAVRKRLMRICSAKADGKPSCLWND